jgi:hypothetical protein
VRGEEGALAEKRKADFFVTGAEKLSIIVIPARDGPRRGIDKRDSRPCWNEGEWTNGDDGDGVEDEISIIVLRSAGYRSGLLINNRVRGFSSTSH